MRGSPQTDLEPRLTLVGIARSFGRREVLTGVDLSVGAGELVGIVGENGSGKSTLLKILVGRLGPDRGRALVHGRLGYCPQEPLVLDTLTVTENFRYFAAAYGLDPWRASMEALLAHFQFAPWRDSLVAEVSGGTRQKLNLCLALLHDPDVLLLDEPYTGFDWESYLKFWEWAEVQRGRGRALLVVSHLIHDRERFSRVLTLRDGRLS
jgi:ABC-type multidrug transport system ATPase subunit